MTTEHYSTIVIGAGSGGMTVAVGLANLGRKVALIEGHHVGGDCTNVGCVPSKTLIHLAKNFRPGMNADDALQEVIRKRDALRDKETEDVQHMENLTFIQGRAKFAGPKQTQRQPRWHNARTHRRSYRHRHRCAPAAAEYPWSAR